MEENFNNSMINVQVIHLSTSHTGGAGIAARRLNLALNDYGIKSIFVAIEKVGYQVKATEVAIKRSLRNKLFSYLNARFSKLFMQKTYFTFFSISPLNYKKIKKFGPPQTTIIHVHNWFNLISLRVVRKLLLNGYQVIFTLHDQRLFTGGCHYSLTCDKFINSCSKCPLLPTPVNRLTKWNLSRQQKVFYEFADQITVIAPSKWIEKQATKSSTLKKSNIVYSPNIHKSTELAEFSYIQMKSNNNGNKLILGVASMDIGSHLKGGDLLLPLLKLINDNKVNVDVRYLVDYKSSPKSFWEEIDYLLVISRQDNSPNVIHEAKIMGIPIIGTNVGGIPELLNLEYDYIVDFDGEVLHQILNVIKVIMKTPKINSLQKIKEDYTRVTSGSLSNICDIYQSRLNYN